MNIHANKHVNRSKKFQHSYSNQRYVVSSYCSFIIGSYYSFLELTRTTIGSQTYILYICKIS